MRVLTRLHPFEVKCDECGKTVTTKPVASEQDALWEAEFRQNRVRVVFPSGKVEYLMKDICPTCWADGVDPKGAAQGD